jgi:hypothetical protein
MSEDDQIEHLEHDLHAVLDRYRREYEINVVSVVGVLELIKAEIVEEWLDSGFEEDDADLS